MLTTDIGCLGSENHLADVAKRNLEKSGNLVQKLTSKWKKRKQEAAAAATPNETSKPKRHQTTRHYRMMKYLLDGMEPIVPPTDSPEHPAAIQALSSEDPDVAAKYAVQKLTFAVEERLADIFKKAKTPECRQLIATHYAQFLSAVGRERPMPFEQLPDFVNECPSETKYDFDNLPEGVTIMDVQGRTYQPPREQRFHEFRPADEDPDYLRLAPEDEPEYPEWSTYPIEYIENPDDLILLYIILTHDNPEGTIRLVETLHEPGYQFVIHVDGKAESVYQTLLHKFDSVDYVHLVPTSHRVRVNWGGFSMVNATLQALDYTFATRDEYTHAPLHFHKLVHLASTSYPLASNTHIRRTLASFPLDANFLDVVLKPTNPGSASWHYFVECDDTVHRIYRLTPMVSTDWEFDNSEIDIYTSSQWFIISREFAEYMATREPGSLVYKLLEYMEHVVVADESFFGTLLRHTKPFCYAHHNDNFLHLQFDRWENEVKAERDERKCVMPNPDHCGRSPTTMTLDYLPVLELAKTDLFARKFDDKIDSQIKDVIDLMRQKQEDRIRRQDLIQHGQVDSHPDDLATPELDTSFEGHGVLIVAKQTLDSDKPLCLGLGPSKNEVKLVPCFYEQIVPSLAKGWEKGAVILEETPIHNRWELGPCSTDGDLRRLSNATLLMTPGQYIETGPRCHLTQMDGVRQGRCLDAESERVQPTGGSISVYPCRGRWHQFVSFGNGEHAPLNTMHINIPRHVRTRIDELGRGTQDPYLCLGVPNRGMYPDDDQEWIEDLTSDSDDADEYDIEDKETTATLTPTPTKILPKKDYGYAQDGKTLKSWSEWEDVQLVTRKCTHTDAVLEWLFVPFIVEGDGEGPVIVNDSSDLEEDEFPDEL